MARNTQPIVHDERGNEHHPAFGHARMSRVSAVPGAVLFDSDIRHQHYVTLTVSGATRKRELHRDWIHVDKPLVEISFSEAQWGALVSSFGSSGVPCTLSWTQKDGIIPELPFQSRLKSSHDEVRAAADAAMSKVQAAMAAYTEKRSAANLRSLQFAIDALPSNMTFAAESLTEHAEKVVQGMRADLEAMVDARARELGIEVSLRELES